MNVTNWAQISFDAGHAAPHDETAANHGHRYLIRVYWQQVYDPRKPVKMDRAALAAIRDELAGQVLDTMLPAVETTPAGIAAWILERIPSASAAQVSADADAATKVER